MYSVQYSVKVYSSGRDADVHGPRGKQHCPRLPLLCQGGLLGPGHHPLPAAVRRPAPRLPGNTISGVIILYPAPRLAGQHGGRGVGQSFGGGQGKLSLSCHASCHSCHHKNLVSKLLQPRPEDWSRLRSFIIPGSHILVTKSLSDLPGTSCSEQRTVIHFKTQTQDS